MKTALLVCDHVLPDFEKNHGTYPKMFAELLPDLELVPHFACDGDLPDPEDYHSFVCTGSRYSVYDDKPWITDLLIFTRQLGSLQKKFVGICFGHQIIGAALGGKVEQSPHGWQIGVHAFEVAAKPHWMNPAVSNYNVLMLCRDQIVEMPPGGEILAHSATCPIGALQIGDHYMGIQGHPEFSKPYNQAVYTSRSDLIPAKAIVAADKSLQLPVDRSIFTSWVMTFLRTA